MALTASGVGSGLDISGMVSQLMSVEQRPLTALATKEASYQAKLSAFGQLKSSLSALQSAATALNDAAKFTATKATAASDAGFTASSDAGTTTGSYAIQVNNLATMQRSATNALTSYVPTTGTLSITINGETNTLDFSGTTIEELSAAINGGDLGITASVVDNGTAKQLVLSGKDTGTDNAFTATGLGIESSLYEVQPAEDASLTVDGIMVTRSSNTISDILDGVTLTLNKETTSSSSLLVALDTSSASSSISAFVKAYNSTASTLKSLTTYNAEAQQASTLTGDSTARGIQSQMRNLVNSALSGLGDTSRLSDIGISFQLDGTLAIDSTKLDAALKDPARDVAAFFTGTDSFKGFGETVYDGLSGYVDSGGMLAGRTDGINASIKNIEKQRDALQLRLEGIEKRYLAQFTALDTMISSLTQTSNYLTQQLASLPSAG